MLDFLLGLVAGHALFKGKKPDCSKISAEQMYEHEQTKVLIDIVETAHGIEATNPSPDELALQLKPLKMMFDRIDFDGIKSPEGITVYHQVKDYFEENLYPDESAANIPDFEEFRKQLEEPSLSVCFDGENVSESNFYISSWNRRGLFYCTGSTGVLHLFLPDKTGNGTPSDRILAEISNAEYVIASVCDDESSQFYLELLFEDNSPAPYVLHLSKRQVVPGLSREDDNTTDLECQVHIGPIGEKAAEFPLRIRFVDYLPYTKAWGE